MSLDRILELGFGPLETPVDYYRGASHLDKLTGQIAHLRLNGIDKNPVAVASSPESTSPISPKSYTASSAASIHSSFSDVQPTSNYWHIPDKSSYLTSVAVQNDNHLCAIGSGSSKGNLFIYEVYPDEVTHHQTITLPEIHSLKWVSGATKLGKMGNVLASGHRNGYAHLTLLPDSTSRDGNAEILKRYNHMKHLPKTPAADSMPLSLRISNLELTSAKWSSCAASSLFTLCGDHLFLWEANRSDVPLVMQKSHNTHALGLCDTRDGVFALGRKRGVCIRDIRVRDKANSGLKPPVDNNETVSIVSWNPHDGGNQLAAVHDRRTIKIWDIRSKQPLASYSRHGDTITSLRWSAKSELVSASADGTVRVWDTENTMSDPKGSHNLSEEASNWGDYSRRQTMDSELEGFTNDLLSNSMPVNHARHFVSMALAPMGPSMSAVTIDSDSCLGVHELSDCADTFTNFSSSSFSSIESSSGFLSPI